MQDNKILEDRISYNESCFIVNAMNFYIGNCYEKAILNENDIKYYKDIVGKYEKLENDILKLRIK